MKTLLIVSLLILFSVVTVSAGEITVTNPNSQSIWVIGTKQDITWKVPGDTPNLTITLWQGSTKVGVIADGIVVEPTRAITYTMTHSWKVGDLLGEKALPGNNYRIGIQAKGTRYCHKSPYFEIREMKAFNKEFPKAKFWDLSIDRMEVKPHYTGKITWSENHPEHNVIYIPIHDIPSGLAANCWVSVTAYIKMKTPPKSQITKADVSKWGSSGPHNSCEVRMKIFHNPGLPKYGGEGTFSIMMPTFTWEDVQTWPKEGKTFVKGLPALNWQPEESYVSGAQSDGIGFVVDCRVDHKLQISETDEVNNNNYFLILFRTHQEGPRLELYPYPNTTRLIGSTMEIRWKAKGIERMEILLWQNNDFIGVIADNIVPPPPGPNIVDMSYNWKVGHLLGGEVAKSGKDYWIMIKSEEWVDGVALFWNQTTERYYLKLHTGKKIKIIPN